MTGLYRVHLSNGTIGGCTVGQGKTWLEAIETAIRHGADVSNLSPETVAVPGKWLSIPLRGAEMEIDPESHYVWISPEKEKAA